MQNAYDQNEVQYESTGWGAMSDTKTSSGEWLDFKQGRGDTHVLRILEIHGIRMKSFRGGRPNKHLEMTVELWESNGEKFNPPKTVKTNPRASWCNELRKEAERVASSAGWDGQPKTYGNYANTIGDYYIRVTRNDDVNTNRGHLTVQNLGHLDDQGDDTGTKPPANTNSHDIAILQAQTQDELRDVFGAAWQSTTDKAEREAFKALYEQQKEAIDSGNTDVPF